MIAVLWLRPMLVVRVRASIYSSQLPPFATWLRTDSQVPASDSDSGVGEEGWGVCAFAWETAQSLAIAQRHGLVAVNIPSDHNSKCMERTWKEHGKNMESKKTWKARKTCNKRMKPERHHNDIRKHER